MRLTDLIFEQKIPPDIEEAYGLVLFGEWQKHNGMNVPFERDTEYEKQVMKILNKWFTSININRSERDELFNLSQVVDFYPNILKPDPVSKYPYLYRGLSNVTRSFPRDKNAKKIGQLSIKYKEFEIFKSYKSIEYEPQNFLESWTISIEKGIEFLTNNYEYETGFVIIKAAVPESERMFNLKFTEIINEMEEQEVVRAARDSISAEIFFVNEIKEEDE